MSRPCSCCVSPARNAIDAAILNGEPESSIAARFNVSRSSVNRHKAHPPTSIVKAESIREVREALTIQERETALVERIDRALDRAEGNGDLRALAPLLREAREMITLRMKREGQLPGPTINVQITRSPEWRAIRETIYKVLQPHVMIRDQLVRELPILAHEKGGTDGND